MMMYLFVALAMMMAATLIQHLGLAEAITEILVKVLSKVASCNQCFTFWLSLAALLCEGCTIVWAIALAILMAYLSNWFVLLLMILQRLFSKIYNREKEYEQERKYERKKVERKKAG